MNQAQTVERGDGEIERGEQSSEAEERSAGGPDRQARIGTHKKGRGHASKRGHGGPKRKQIHGGERHLARADLQRQEIVAEPCLRRGGEHQENHQGTVKHGERGVALRRSAESGKKRNLRRRPDQMNAHKEGEKHSKENTAQGKPEITQTDHFVTSVENGAGEKTGSGHFGGRVPAAVVGEHAECHYTPACRMREAAWRDR